MKLERVKRVLLIRHRRIGDVVTVTPCIRAIKETFPDVHLAVLVDKSTEGVLRGHPMVDELIVLDKDACRSAGRAGKLCKEAAFLWGLRRRRFDLVINLHGGPRSAIETLCAGARYRLGGFPSWHHWNWVYNIRTRPLREVLGAGEESHIVLRHLATLRAAGITTADTRLVMGVTGKAQASLDRLLASQGLTAGRDIVVIFPASRRRDACWPAERFAQVADWLVQEFAVTVVLVAGPGERAVCGEVRAAMQQEAIDLSGLIGLQELAALLQRSAMFIGLDGGPIHIAAAVGTPIVGLYGPTSDTWRPWTTQSILVRPFNLRQRASGECPQAPSAGMDGISVAQVCEAVRRLRARLGSAGGHPAKAAPGQG